MMLRSIGLSKYVHGPVKNFTFQTPIKVIASYQKGVPLRYYAVDGNKSSQNIKQEKLTTNLIKDTSPQIRNKGTDPTSNKVSQNSSGSSNNSWKKIAIFLSPIIAAAVVYQIWSSSNEEGGETVSETNKKKKKRKDLAIQKFPQSSADIPSQVPYLLIGGGTASFAAFRAIKSSDPTAQVLVISNEPYYPYMRPPLSKELFYDPDRNSARDLTFKQWNGKERSLFYEPEDFYADVTGLISAKNGGIAVARGWSVSKVEPQNRKVILEDGKEISYRKCLIATGAKPKNLPIFQNASEKIKEKVMLYRNIYDFEELEDVMSEGAKSLVIIGGGFLGSELACALARRGKQQGLTVHQIFREEGNMAHVLPDYLSKWTTEKVKNEGVQIINKAEVTNVEMENDRLRLSLNNGRQINADYVVVAVGVEPNTDLSKTSNLEVDNKIGGFVANSELEARSNLYVAGDCASFYDEKLGRRRIEHHDNAVVSGRLAGENMTGASKTYKHQAMLWSDLGPEVGYEAIGIVNSSLPTFAVYAKSTDLEQNQEESQEKKTSPETSADDYVKGVIFYLKDNVIVGIMLWNIFNRIGIARQVLAEGKTFEDLSEVAKLFDIHNQV